MFWARFHGDWMNWNKILQGRQNEYPSELLIRFVARNYYDLPFHEQITFLDIGSGAGANAMFLASKGFHVITVDKAITAHAQHQRDINECEFNEKQFDCIVRSEERRVGKECRSR